jgi:predicted O-methyltransferase YrrM
MVLLDQLKMADADLRDRMDTLLDAPAELLLPERVLLYALVRGLRPERCLEIGSHFGGSTTIIGAALDDGSDGRLVCVDPNPLVPAAVWETVAHRATMLRGYSPAILPAARAEAGGDFDFIFIDGDHSREGVVRDVDGVLDVAAPGAHLLFHDSHYFEVAAAIGDCLTRHSGVLVDCGTVSTMSTPEIDGARWGGFRLLRVQGADGGCR